MFKLFVILFAVCSVSQASIITLEARNVSGAFLMDRSEPIALALQGDMLVTRGIPDGETDPHWIVFRMKEGEYVQVAAVPTGASMSDSWNAYNNGEWFGGLFRDGYYAAVKIFKLDEMDNPVNITQNTLSNYMAELLSDNTIFYYNFDQGTFESLLFNDTDFTWYDGPGFSAPNRVSHSYPATAHWIDDTNFTYINDAGQVFFFTRQADRSWTQTDTFTVDSSIVSSFMYMYYNSIDTVVFSQAYLYNTFSIFTKIEGQWVKQNITIASRTSALSFVSLNQNAMILGIQNDDSGNALLFERQNNAWVNTAQISAETPSIVGVGMALTNDSLILSNGARIGTTYSYNTNFLALPICALEPMDVTCTSSQLESSCENSTIDTSLYTINNPCNGFDQVSILNSTSENATMLVTVGFERGAFKTSCQITVPCIVPPTAPVTSPLTELPTEPSTDVPSKPSTVPHRTVSSASVMSVTGALAYLVIAGL